MFMNLYRVDLPVPDLDRAESFYRKLLNVPTRRVSPSLHHFDCGGMILTCSDAGQNQEPGDSAPRVIYFAVEDLETIFSQAQQAGCASLDPQIDHQPWGHRSFTAQDPFGNALVFVDETTMQREVDERLTAGPDDLLHVGVALSVESLEEDSQDQPIAASVAKIFEDEIWIRFAEASPDALLRENEAVRIRFWIGEEVYLAETTVITAPPGTGHVATSVPREATALQRRAVPRVPLPIPVSFSVFADSEEVEEKSFQTESKDISTDGLRLETDAPLKEGDKVWLQLSLSSSETIRIVANVRRTRQIDGGRISAGLQFVEMQLEDQMKLLKLLIQDTPVKEPESEKVDPVPVEVEDEVPAPPVATPEVSPDTEEEIPPVKEPEDPVPVEVEDEAPAPLDATQEVPKDIEEAAPVKELENDKDDPVPVEVENEPPAPLDATQEVPKDMEEAAPVKELENDKDEPVPVEVEDEPPAPLDATQEVPKDTEEAAPVKEPEVVAPEEEQEEGEESLLPFVLIVPEVEGGRALIQLTNGYHKPIRLKDVLLIRGVHSIPLLEEGRELAVDEAAKLDVTEKMLTLFNPESSRTQYKRFQISLRLEPEPTDQPAPSTYVLSFAKGSFTEFSGE